jgi:hypothetical protein
MNFEYVLMSEMPSYCNKISKKVWSLVTRIGKTCLFSYVKTLAGGSSWC